MKIIVIGGTGVIGSSVIQELKNHEVIVVGHSSGDFQCNIEIPASIQQLFATIGTVDAIVVAAGDVHFEELANMTADKYEYGLKNKLMGQVNVVLLGTPFLNDHGSFTLTSGTASHDPVKGGSSASLVNGAIDSFVRAAAIELPRGIRINSICPTILTESMAEYGDYFRGFESVPARKVALAYVKSIEGAQTGQNYRVG